MMTPCTTTIVLLHHLPKSGTDDLPEVLVSQVEFLHAHGQDPRTEAIATARIAHESGEASMASLAGYDIQDHEWRQAEISSVLIGHRLPILNQTSDTGPKMDGVPVAGHPDDWRSLAEGQSRILIGALSHADRHMIQLQIEDGSAYNIQIIPPMFSDLDMLMNPRFMLGARRAILARPASCGWQADLVDAMTDVDGHGCSPGI